MNLRLPPPQDSSSEVIFIYHTLLCLPISIFTLFFWSSINLQSNQWTLVPIINTAPQKEQNHKFTL